MLKSVLNKFAVNEKVTSDMIMGDIIRLHPEVVDTLIGQGMHCLLPVFPAGKPGKRLLRPWPRPGNCYQSRQRCH